MVKLLASGDHHFDEHRRFDECRRIHRWMVDLAAEERPDVFLSAGDIYERGSTPAERGAVADFLISMAEICPVVIARGNHDRRQDLEILGRLESKHPILVEERAAVHMVAGMAIAVVAWPSRSSIAAMAGVHRSVDDTAASLLRNVYSGLGARLSQHDGPRVLLTHAMIDGSVTSTGQPLVGAELRVGLADLGLAGADITIAGHIHKPQEWTWNGAPVVYTGSPFRTAFGEVEEKSIVRAEFGNDGRLARWDRIQTPCSGMVLIECDWSGGLFTNGGAQLHQAEIGSVDGAEVRFRYSVPRDRRDEARTAAEGIRGWLTECGAVAVKVEEEVIVETRARTPEVSQARTIGEKFLALWKAKGVEVSPERAERIGERVAEIESEVALRRKQPWASSRARRQKSRRRRPAPSSSSNRRSSLWCWRSGAERP